MSLSNLDRAPVVMSLTCLDPSGGMGLQADIEAVGYLGGHLCPVITAVVARDTCEIKDIVPLRSTLIIEQARTVLEDMSVQAIKVGMLGTIENVVAVSTLLSDYPAIPVVYDPVLKSLSHEFYPSGEMLAGIVHDILPLSSVIILHQDELSSLTQSADSIEASAQEIMATGCDNVLIVNTRSTHHKIVNAYYGHRRYVKSFEWDRLAHAYLGAGSTLSGSIAAFLAQGFDMPSAIRDGQAYTWKTLKFAQRLGMGKHIPKRIYQPSSFTPDLE